MYYHISSCISYINLASISTYSPSISLGKLKVTADKACALLKDLISAELKQAESCLTQVKALIKSSQVNASCSDKVLDAGVKLHAVMRDHADEHYKCMTSGNPIEAPKDYGLKNQYCKRKLFIVDSNQIM